MNLSNFLKPSPLVALLALVTPGCGDDVHDHDHTEEVAPLEDACEHMADGPIAAGTAVAEGSADAPVLEDHVRLDLALIAVDGGNGGTASFAAAEAGEYLFALSADVPLMLFDGNGTEVTLAAPGPEDGTCSLAASAYALDAAIGTYTLSFGPTIETTVSVVALPVGHDDHAHE